MEFIIYRQQFFFTKNINIVKKIFGNIEKLFTHSSKELILSI